MPKLPAFEPVFQRLMDDPAASLDRLRADPQDFEDNALDEEKGALRTDAAIPALESISALVFDQAGALVGQFGPQWLPQVHAFADLLNRANLPSNHTNLLSFRSDEGGAVNAVWAKNEDAADWNLPKAVRSAIDANPLGHIALSVSGAESGRALQEAARSFGLTSLEQKIVAAVVRSGSGRGAANATGLSYATVRESLAKASRRMNAPNLPALVKKVVAAAFGVLPSDHDGSAMIAEMLPLTERQANIAVMIADGVSRKETAIAMRLSAAVVKKELEQIFALLGVTSAAELARLVVEVRALRAFARSTDGAPGFFDSSIEPTRFLSRPNDREIIAWSDYGPASGRPVLGVHSNWSCRSVPRPLVVRLQAAGWRPIAIDRPGFGSTHPGALSRGDPFGQAIADTIQVLDRIGIERIAVIARCGAQYVTAVKHAIPRRIGPVVLISPSAPTAESARRHGVVGVIKEAFHRSPRLIVF
jgi:DNA-binding NarL/FixJ family response regulator